jgi:hypothetical protein
VNPINYLQVIVLIIWGPFDLITWELGERKKNVFQIRNIEKSILVDLERRKNEFQRCGSPVGLSA